MASMWQSLMRPGRREHSLLSTRSNPTEEK
jgi:hypothetical protein